MLKDVCGFAEHQKKYLRPWPKINNNIKKNDDILLDKAAGIAYARIKIGHIL